MFSPAQLRVVARILYIALGYGSRSERIALLRRLDDPGVGFAVSQLTASGFLPRDNSGVVVDPK